jgi:hypothetical protein
MAVDAFHEGRYGMAAFHTAMAVTDVSGVKALVSAGGKIGAKVLLKATAEHVAEQRAKMAAVRAAGKVGEEAAGFVKNTQRIPSLTGTANFRVPDMLDLSRGMVGESKNVARLSLTSQIKDDIAFAQQRNL